MSPRTWLLTGTALKIGLFAGAMGLMTPAVALANDCDGNTNEWICSGTAPDATALSADDTFYVDFESDFDSNNFPVVINADQEITGGTEGTNGIELHSGASISYDSGTALSIYDPGFANDGVGGGDGVVLNIDEGASIKGLTGLFIGQSESGTGKIIIHNNGSVYGDDGPALEAAANNEDGAVLLFELENHTYAGGIVGAGGGVYVHDINDGSFGPGIVYAQINNGNGLIAGTNGAGVEIADVYNTLAISENPDGSARPAVGIFNNDSGIIASLNGDGVLIHDVDGDGPDSEAAGDNPWNDPRHIVVANDSFYDNQGTFHEGGLIAGGSNGVDIYNATGPIDIFNSGTLDRSMDLTGVDPVLAAAAPPSRGIFGGEDGVVIHNTEGDININNGAFIDDHGRSHTGGLIVGYEGSAVDIYQIGEEFDPHVNIDNQAGLMWGGTNGAYVWDVEGALDVNNTGGTIFGGEYGLYIGDIVPAELDGHVWIGNAGGFIYGYYEDGIYVSGATNVWIDNGDFDAFDQTGAAPNGGLIVGDYYAIDVDADHASIGNGTGGVILGRGDGGYAVIYADTKDITEDGSPGGTDITNLGLITNWDSPYITEPEFPDAGVAPIRPFDATAFAHVQSDINSISSFVWSGGKMGSIAALPSYHDAAQQLAVETEGGRLYLQNDGILVGRVEAYGSTYDYTDEGNSEKGNIVVNRGVWLTTNQPFGGGDFTEDGGWFSNISMSNLFLGSYGDEVQNGGLIQTAFDSSRYEFSSFFGLSNFYNGGYWDKDGFVARDGLVSMIDGGVGDGLAIGSDFIGGQGGSLTSFIGLDVNFAPGTPEIFDPEDDYFSFFGADPTTFRSDKFLLGSYYYETGGVAGSTGLIINKAGTGTNMIGDSIIVGYSPLDNNDESQQCFDRFCRAGDTVYIAPGSSDYANLSGIGVVQDGMFAWHLTEQQGEEVGDPAFVLVSDWGPRAAQMPALIGGAENIWYDTAGQVGDALYGGHFPLNGSGGGGADLPMAEPEPAPAPAATGGWAGWAKAGGSVFSRNTSVTQTLAGPPPTTVTVDTSLVQGTFALLAGGDYSPNGPGSDGLRIGGFGGFIGSELTMGSYGASARYAGGTVGGYASFTSGGFYVDGEAKADLLSLTYSAPFGSATGMSTSIGVMGNAGYRIEYGAAYVEPLGSLSIVETMLSGFTAGGATVSFSNATSVRGGAGVRVGTALDVSDQYDVDVNLVAKVWNEFAPPNIATLTDGAGNSATFSDSISGLFGEIRGTATAFNTDSGLSGYATTGVKFNSTFAQWDAKVGIRKQF